MKAGNQDGAKRHALTVEQRIQRIRERLGLPDRSAASGVPVRIFIPRTADIGKPRG